MKDFYKQLNWNFTHDIPLIASMLNQSSQAIYTALNCGMSFEFYSGYKIKIVKGKYVVEDWSFRYDGSISGVIEVDNWNDFVRAMAVLTHGIKVKGIQSDYWKNTFKEYVDANMNNTNIITSDFVRDEVR
ncbi:MAG: hypothetical protein ACRC92_04140 [Peptostreptococcaceae bacterium]